MDQKKLTQFLAKTKENYATVFVEDDGWLWLSVRRGIADGMPVHDVAPVSNILLETSQEKAEPLDIDLRAFKKFVRSSKGGLKFRIEGDTFYFSSDEVGELSETTRGYVKPVDVLAKPGKAIATVPVDLVTKVEKYKDRADDESTRFALACVLFDEDDFAWTDGRRLVQYQHGQDIWESDKGSFLVDKDVVELAAKWKEPIVVFEECVVVDDVVVTRNKNRWPDRRKVMTGYDTATTVECKDLKEKCKKHISKVKVEGGGDDDWGVNLELVDPKTDAKCEVTLDARYLLACIKDFDKIEVGYDSQAISDNWLRGQVTIKSDELPEFTEVIMPRMPNW